MQRKTEILDRSKPPKPGSQNKVSFPKYVEKNYANGFKSFVVENHELPIVTIGFVVKSGATFDGSLPGLASVTSELITKGTKKRSAVKIAEEIDFLGGSLSTNASWDASQVFVSILKNHLDAAFDVLHDIVINPTFPQVEIERVKIQRLASIQQLKADAGYLADTRFAAVVFRDHPYGNPHGGTEQSMNTMTRKDFMDFHNNYYVPGNSFIVFAGDITSKEAEKYVKKYFLGWKGKKKDFAVPPMPSDGYERKVVIVDKPAAVQSALRIGGVGIARNDRNYIKVMVMNTLLGGYFSSRINQNLREAHGYTYGGRSGFDARALPGFFEVSADVRNEVTSETIEEVFKELSRIRDTVPSKDEMVMVKNYLVGLFPIQLETPQQVAARVISIELYHLPKTYYNKYRGNIRRLTAKDIRTTARRYIKPEKLYVVLSGNSKEIKNKLGNFGAIEIVDSEGKRKS
ncbi:MAG: pitrilysin family protein [Candidatus Kryptoniota bacterium]